MFKKKYRVVTDSGLELDTFYFKFNADKCAKDWNEDAFGLLLEVTMARVEKI